MKYNSLNEIEKNLANVILNESTSQDLLRQVVAKTESKNVETHVYAKYRAKAYENRGIDGGLADEKNVVLTSAGSNGQSIKLTYENIAEGVDTLSGQGLADTIIEGKTENWSNPNGKWSDKRDFITPTIEELSNTNDLRNAMIATLRNAGYQVK